MAKWVLAAGLSEAERSAFVSPEAAMALRGELVNDSKTNFTQRVELSGRRYYVKRYLIPGKHLRRFLGRSRVAKEWRNIGWFDAHRVRTPRRIAMGQGNRWRGPYWGLIVTEEAAQTIDLRRVYLDSPELFQNLPWRREVISQLAEVIFAMHSQGFIHNDLQWRNILVNPPGSPETSVCLIDCPAGRRIYLPGNRRGVVRDLAFLDKMAKLALSKTDRLRFYMLYRRTTRLRERDKKEIRRILRFLS